MGAISGLNKSNISHLNSHGSSVTIQDKYTNVVDQSIHQTNELNQSLNEKIAINTVDHTSFKHSPLGSLKKSITLLARPLLKSKHLNQSVSEQNLETIKKSSSSSSSASSSSSTKRPSAPPITNQIKNTQRSYFSSCSSCDTSSTPTITTGNTATTTLTKTPNYLCGLNSNSNNNNSTSTATTLSRHSSDSSGIALSPKYNSISIIFILIGLFSINFFQETLLILYFYNTEQFYWFVYSMVALFSGQTITLILSLLAEIDLINLSPPTAFKSKSTTNIDKNKNNNTVYINENDVNYNAELYSVFTSPFSKLFLLVPGFLSLSVYIQFFRHVFNYRKASAHRRFKLEFQLSLYLFFNSIFHSLPLAIINACYVASTTRTYSLSWYYTEFFSIFKATSASFTHHSLTSVSSSSSSQTQILIDNSSSGNERRSNLVLLLVSIFISVSIGICLFITYYELMKQMNFLSVMKNNVLFTSNNPPPPSSSSSKQQQQPKGVRHFIGENLDQKLESLGLVEVLVYFCYRFCLVTSRLSVIALFWYLFNEWLLLAVLVHVCFGVVCTFSTVKSKKSSSASSYILDRRRFQGRALHHHRHAAEKLTCSDNSDNFGLIVESSSSSSSSSTSSSQDGITAETAIISLNAIDASQKKTSRLNQHLTLFIVCLLSFIDLFMNQLSELYHIRKVFVYYLIYLIQNVCVLTYWLVKTILNAKYQLENEHLAQHSKNTEINSIVKFPFTTSSIKQPFLVEENSSASIITNASPTAYACYATIIYLCIILFTIFGLVLKFLHLHILRKRFRRLYN